MARSKRYSPEDAIDDINETLKLLVDLQRNYVSIWEKAESFFTDVRARLKDVRLTLQDSEEVTPRQASAISKWGEGVRKWHPEFRD